MNQYVITREEYHNEFGRGKGASFYIKERKPFLFFFKKWSYVTHRARGYKGYYRERTKFQSVPDAREFIKHVLCTGLERDGMSNWVMERINC